MEQRHTIRQQVYNAYKDVSSAQKEAMVISSKVLTSKEIRKQGKHIFGRIEKLVRFAD